MLILDTFEDSEFHEEASSGLDRIPSWHIPAIVFHELVWFFRAEGIPLQKVNSKIEEYLTNEKSKFLPRTADDVRFAFDRIKNLKDYNDLIILSSARRLALPLFTFDAQFKKIAVKEGVKIV